MKKIFKTMIAIAFTVCITTGVAGAEFRAPAGDPSVENRISVVYHDPAVVAGRKTSDPDTLTYSKVTIKVGTESSIRVISKLDTEISNEMIDPVDLTEMNDVQEFENEHSFYLKDGQMVTVLIPNNVNYEVISDAIDWFPCGYGVTEETSWYIANKWIYPSSNSFESVVDTENVTVDIYPFIGSADSEAGPEQAVTTEQTDIDPEMVKAADRNND